MIIYTCLKTAALWAVLPWMCGCAVIAMCTALRGLFLAKPVLAKTDYYIFGRYFVVPAPTQFVTISIVSLVVAIAVSVPLALGIISKPR